MAEGKVDFFNDTGGYGFIDTGRTRTTTFSSTWKTWAARISRKGREVEFDIEQADKGPRATNLTRL